jgi:hypothetical protein
MEFCITAEQLRSALKDIEQAEKNGFMHCLAVFRFVSAGPMIDQNQANYSDLLERASPTDDSLNWGRFQSVTRHFRFADGKLIDPQSTKIKKKRDP